MATVDEQRASLLSNDLVMGDEEHLKPPISPMCVDCVHVYNYGIEQMCKAFPTGIPDEIWSGMISHRRAYQGDGGIQYSRKETT